MWNQINYDTGNIPYNWQVIIFVLTYWYQLFEFHQKFIGNILDILPAVLNSQHEIEENI